MEQIVQQLFELQDNAYADFQAKLTPGIPRESIIGVRLPLLRKMGKKLAGTREARLFLQELPHTYYDENLLHGLLISEEKNYDLCIEELEAFLPYVDNWAVCDTMSPKVFRKKKEELMKSIRKWTGASHVYTCRFGMGMLMRHFLDEDFRQEALEIPAKIRSDEYYINMMTAWLFATALAKQWDAAIGYLTEERLDVWTHNKTIQKARESFRITPEQKEYLKTLKR